MTTTSAVVLGIIQLQFWKDGTRHLPEMREMYCVFERSTEEDRESLFTSLINKPYEDPVHHPEGHAKHNKFRTGFVYHGERIKPTPENEEDFRIAKSFYISDDANLIEIWRYSFKDDQ